MDFLKLTAEKLNVGDISDLVADESCGAISLFVGTTRDNFEEKKVLSLEYVAYEPMAIKMMKEICGKIREDWSETCKIAIYHRIGLVPVKEASVVIAISSPHRKDSLEAVQYAIDELKKSVPIWKKEKYSTDESAWKENKECPQTQLKNKRFKLDFESCPVESESISEDLVQIRANETEIVRRIHCFVEKKREEIDLNNILDFTTTKRTIDELKHQENDENSCARTNTIVIKQTDSKGHLRIRRVKNRTGPQIKPDYLLALDKLMKTDPDSENMIKEEVPDAGEELELPDVPHGLRERLQNIESHLNMRIPNPKHIYERIKAIEDKILYLESISPEYKHFLAEKPHYIPETTQPFSKKVYSVDDIDDLIEELKADIDREEQREESS